MKTLNNQTLLYDQECPLCNAYTAGFIKAGMLDKNGRKPYTSLTETDCQFIDANRARNEIALVDYTTKTVTYGIESLLKVVGHSFPLIEKVGKAKPVYWLLKKLYSFISYNRKVIIPNKKQDTALQCVPDFNLKYRVLYIMLAGMMTAWALYKYSEASSYGVAERPYFIELIIAFGQIPFQWLLVRKYSKETQFEYFGNLMTVSLFGSMLLVVAMFINMVFKLPGNLLLVWFLTTALIMFLEHYRRIKLLNLTTGLCAGWFLYRLLLLASMLLYIFVIHKY